MFRRPRVGDTKNGGTIVSMPPVLHECNLPRGLKIDGLQWQCSECRMVWRRKKDIDSSMLTWWRWTMEALRHDINS